MIVMMMMIVFDDDCDDDNDDDSSSAMSKVLETVVGGGGEKKKKRGRSLRLESAKPAPTPEPSPHYHCDDNGRLSSLPNTKPSLPSIPLVFFSLSIIIMIIINRDISKTITNTFCWYLLFDR